MTPPPETQPVVWEDGLRLRAARASLVVSAILVVAKLFAYLVTGSIVMLSALIDSTIDVLTCLTTLAGVQRALRPADAEYRYGHGKAEPLAALVQGAFVAGSAVILGYEAINRLIHPAPVAMMALGMGVMVLSIVLTLALVLFQKYVVRKTGSVAIGASHLLYSGDLGLNFAVIVALELEHVTGAGFWDPLFALVISALLLWGAARVAIRALKLLLDRELPDSERGRITGLVMAHEAARGVHDLRTRSDGKRTFIEMHLELDGSLTLTQAHDIADDIERMLKATFPDSDILIHQEPAGLNDDRLDTRIEANS